MKRENRLNKTSIIEDADEDGKILSLKFLEGVADIIYGGTVRGGGGGRFCMLRAEDCTTASHTWLKGSLKELPGEKQGSWVVMAPPLTRLPVS